MKSISLALVMSLALTAAATAADTSWIERSNRNAQLLLELGAKYSPESAASLGLEGHDADIMDLQPGHDERFQADLASIAQRLEGLRAGEQEASVKQDLDILIAAANSQRTSSVLNRKYLLPFFDLPAAIFGGFQDLLDARVAKERQKAALQRLRRYVGAEKGYTPVTVLARQEYEAAATNPALIGPWVVEAQQYVDNQGRYLDGIEQLLQDSGLKGWQKDMRTLRQQVDEYGKWVRSTVLPRARKASQLPAAIYADNLKQFGVQMSPQELIDRAQSNYIQTRDEIDQVARTIAAQRNWDVKSYRDVIRRLKQEKIPKEKLLPLYSARLAQLEDIVRREHVLTLPARKAVIRLATEAESAATPAPHVDPPRLVGNTGEPAEFVLPVDNPNAKPGVAMDDFSYDAIAWTLTAHEARPGHELQFASMMERGVSTARVVYAFNSANVEGWALYAEALMKQYMPPEGQLGVLQMRMMREARAFLDPMLNLGLIQPDAAQRFLMQEVVLSEPMAKQEVDRYTFKMPGQATSYFYGYSKLNALRTKVELALSARFNEQAYHDFLLSQGLLPFDLMEKAVLEQFVPAQLGK